ncbi:MAG: transcription termination/antitermination protein NusA [Rickettsiales bacterium]|nr:transcription termination/antitermination protein NusA [Rickettsiales bacterium]|tara:strand:- start:7303 stop:8844 length:1542 start_codon:yes stop_codon:yes gene_type:complete
MVTVHNEILQVADVVAREKLIDRETVIQAMEEAIQKIALNKYGMDHDIRVTIDRKTGEITIKRYREVVEEVEDENKQISLAAAKEEQPEATVGQYLTDVLPPVSFGRMAAQTARQIVNYRVKEAEKERQYEEFKDKVGEIISGIVKRVEYGNYIIDVNRNECVLRRDEAIPREVLRPGDRVRAYILEVVRDTRGPQIFLSRSHPQFMAKLFTQEVPEVYEGVIEILSVARDPGSRAKIAVRTNDQTIDPVGSCVGVRGSRVQAVVNELQGERVDIVPWTADVPSFVISALAPADISRVVYDEESRRVQVVVPDDNLSIAIGRRGQNVRLASLLTGLEVSVMSESDDTQKRNDEFKQVSTDLINELGIDEVIAHLLISEGFDTLDAIAFCDLEEMLEIEGFEEGLATELQKRAQAAVEKRHQEIKKKVAEMGVDKSLSEFEPLTPELLMVLAENNCRTLDDLADLAGDELVEMFGEDNISLDVANDIIMQARAHWFDDDATEASVEKDEADTKA